VTDTAAGIDDRALRAVVFDFDGLMVDTESTALRSWQRLYQSFGEDLPLEKWVELIGTWDALWDPRAELEQRLGRPLDWTAIEPERMAVEHGLADEQPLLPGVETLIEEALEVGLRLAVASSSSHSWVTHHLERLGLTRRFAVLATRHDVTRTKPDPALYSLALARLGVRPSQAFALEDSVHGVASAKHAGLAVVAVPGPIMREADFSAADLRVDSLAHVTLAGLASSLGFQPPAQPSRPTDLPME